MWHLDLKNVLGLQVRKKDIAIKKRKKDIAIKKKRFYFLSSWSAYNMCIYITDKDAMSMFLCSWKNKNIPPNTGTQKRPYLKSQLGP